MIRVFLFTFALSFTAQAYVGSVSSGTGGAGRAAIEASENPFGNPAGIAYLTGYYFSAGYGSSKQTSLGANQDLAVSLTDNMRETVVPTSLSYVQTTVQPELGTDSLQRDFRLSFGNFIRPGFAFGLTVVHQDDRLESESFNQTNLETGFLLAPNKDLGFGLTFESLLAPKEEIPEPYRAQQRMGLGVSWNIKKVFRFKADLSSKANNNWGGQSVAGGMESYLNKWLILRLGAAQNADLEASLYSAGMGFVGPRFGLNYAYQNSPQKDSLTRHSVDLAVPIW